MIRLAAATILISWLSGPPAYSAATPTCEGERATLVGSPGHVVRGTDSHDVIVTNGARRVISYDGDDLVCVTDGGPRTTISTHDGDDRVVVVSTRENGSVSADLHTGADSFVGGREPDVVTVRDGGDDIATGPGDDFAAISSRGEPSTVSLGRGRDEFALPRVVSFGGAPAVDAGPGRDQLTLGTAGGLDVVVDNIRGSLAVGGREVLRWTSVEAFELGTVVAPHLTFLGSGAAERVALDPGRLVPSRVGDFSIAVGGGRDEVRLSASTDGELEGGGGRDSVHVLSDVSTGVDSLVADLTAGSARATVGGTVHGWSLTGIENLAADSGFGLGFQGVEVTGTSGRNRIVVAACSATITGLDGDDLLTSSGATCGDASTRRSTVDGGEGDDVLRGSDWRDTLDGGTGTDTADGQGRRDICHAETTVECELP